ncbi:MAG TPA: hypothetical protein VD993_14135 [Chitinophagaceae bacterium]|nr:hypothetical protein [Chitinophagaceae bacterium]
MENIPLAGWLMLALTLACVAIVTIGLNRALLRTGWQAERRRKIFTLTVLGIDSWLFLLAILAVSGVFSDFSTVPPKVVLVPLTGIFISLLVTFSKWFTDLLRVLPRHWLVYFQSFRIPVELLLWFAFSKGLIPVQMTFEGYNFDVLSGILALPAGWALATGKPYAKTLGIAYNIVGLLLLANIVTIAVLSMPTPLRQFMNEPANTIVATFPFIYLPGVLVVLAFAFHAFSLRQLLRRNH